jgi:hypothetical protein
MIDTAFAQLQPLLNTKTARELLGKSRATHYHRCRPTLSRPRRTRPPANALTPADWAQVLASRNSWPTCTSATAIPDPACPTTAMIFLRLPGPPLATTGLGAFGLICRLVSGVASGPPARRVVT